MLLRRLLDHACPRLWSGRGPLGRPGRDVLRTVHDRDLRPAGRHRVPHRLHPGPVPALGRRRRRRVQHPQRGADLRGRRPGHRRVRLLAVGRAGGSPTTTGCRGPTPDGSTSTTWSRSPRPGTPEQARGPPRSGSPTPTTSATRGRWSGVTDSVNQAKGDQDPNEWLPTYDKCRYLREWVAVKHRWRLTVDSAEKSALSSLACRLLQRHDHGDSADPLLNRLLGPRVRPQPAVRRVSVHRRGVAGRRPSVSLPSVGDAAGTRRRA